MDWKYL